MLKFILILLAMGLTITSTIPTSVDTTETIAAPNPRPASSVDEMPAFQASRYDWPELETAEVSPPNPDLKKPNQNGKFSHRLHFTTKLRLQPPNRLEKA